MEAPLASALITSLLSCFIFVLQLKGAMGIDCFKCTSFDGDNSPCDDPFHNNYSSTFLHSPCWAGRKHRDGVFPATACVKLDGKFADTGQSITIRDCALDSGSLTQDTELVRMSHCGGFYYEDRYVSGCVQSCSQDACNDANKRININISSLPVLLIISIVTYFSNILIIRK